MAKAGKVRTRKRGKTWSYIFEAGQVNGKRKVVEKGGFATEKDAYTAGVEKYNDFLHGNIGITSESITLKDFMTNWLNEVVALNVKATTMQTYKSNFENQIVPSLGGLKVQEITPVILDKWVRELQKKGLSYSSIAAAHALIHHALDYAVHPSRLITSNPVVYVKVPKNAPKNIIKRTIITPTRFKTLLEKYPFGTPFYIPFLLLYHTGMRLGEVLSLSWNDIDFEKKQISPRGQIVYLKRRGYCFTSLKTESSNRYIIVDEYLLGELQRWREYQSEYEHRKDGYIYVYCKSDGTIQKQSKNFPITSAKRIPLVCTNSAGSFIVKTNLIKALREAGLNAHSFRHTHATQLIENGATAKAVASRLGHSNVLITQNLYTHNTLKLQEEAAAIFTKILQTNG